MDDDERRYVDIELEGRTLDVKYAVGIALKARDRQHILAKTRGDYGDISDSSGWWLALSQLLAPFGRDFIDKTAPAVADISRSPKAYEAFKHSVEELLGFLGAQFERRFRSNLFFYSPESAATATLPSFWADERVRLELALERQRRLFERDALVTPLQNGIAAYDDKTSAPAWSDARMKDEIAQCQHTNRDRAWREVFAPRRSEHGWSNDAFRSVWSDARGTKNMKGRISRSK